MEIDVALLALLAGAFALGYVRGGVRQLIALGAWLVSFIVAAFVRAPVADWISGQAPQFSREQAEMLAYLLVFLVLFGLALAAVEIGGKTLHITDRVIVDRFIGGFLALGVALLAIGSVIVILDTHYEGAPLTRVATAELGIVTDIAHALDRSAIVRSLSDSLAPGLVALLGPLLPADVRAVYA